MFTIQAVLGGKVTATIANVVKGNPTFSDGSLTIVNNSEFPKPIYQTSVATEYQEFDIVISNKYDLRYLDSPTCTMGAFDMKSLGILQPFRDNLHQWRDGWRLERVTGYDGSSSVVCARCRFPVGLERPQRVPVEDVGSRFASRIGYEIFH